MPWVHFDPASVRNRKLADLTDADRWRWFALVCWAVENGTDGAVIASDLHRARIVGSARESRAFASRLHRAGLLDLVDGDPDSLDARWQLHDFLDYQTPSEIVDKQRAQARDRRRRYVERHGEPSGAAKRKRKREGWGALTHDGPGGPMRDGPGGPDAHLSFPPPTSRGGRGTPSGPPSPSSPSDGAAEAAAGRQTNGGATLPIAELSRQLADSLRIDP